MLLESRRELFDFMVSVHNGSYRLAYVLINTIPGVNAYVIQWDPDATLGDLIGVNVERVVRVAVQVDGVSMPLSRANVESDVYPTETVQWQRGVDMSYRISSGFFAGEMFDRILYLYPVPSNAVVLELLCVAGPGGTESVSLTGIINDLGYDEYLVLDGMIKCLQMEESDPSVAIAQKDRLIQRIQNEAAPIDDTQAPTIQDVRSRDSDAGFSRRGA